MWRPDGLETHTREYYTGTRVVKIENVITKKPQALASSYLRQ